MQKICRRATDLYCLICCLSRTMFSVFPTIKATARRKISRRVSPPYQGFSPLCPSHYFKFLSIKSKGSSTHIFTALSFCIQDPVCLFPLLHYFVCTTVIILLAQICVGVLAALQQSYMGTELRLNIY